MFTKHFCKGKFTVNKTGRYFSNMPLDEAHEQNNAVVKGNGGAIDLTENPDALLRWMICGPEVTRILEEFKNEIKPDLNPNLKHHDDSPGKQKKFEQRVSNLITTISKMGNPFNDMSEDLLVLSTREIMEKDIVASLKSIKSNGTALSAIFFQERLITCEKPIDATIQRITSSNFLTANR